MTIPQKWRSSPLLYPAIILSLASLAWTTWSLVDLLGAGFWGLTVAAGADVIWGSVIVAEARGLRVTVRKKNIVPAFGWSALAVVVCFLAWHGLAQHSYAMAAGGPFLPVGAKAVWVLALTDMLDPAALTHDELHVLARMERGMAFEEAQHRISMRRQRMSAELLMDEVSTDFDIEVMRQDRARDLRHRAPLAITSGVDQPFDRAAEQAIKVIGEQAPSIPSVVANTLGEQATNSPLNRANSDPEQPSIADLVRDQIAVNPNNADAIRGVMLARPDANKDSVAAAVRRERRKNQPKDGYA